jgi:parallel beta-helix repeat protein
VEDVTAGDEVRLACGATWREALRIGVSGTSQNPIRVVAYPASCATPPVIDGGAAIASSAWSVYRNSIYRATLDTEPLIVTSTAGYMDPAHFPTRGYDPVQPTSPYLKMAADANVTSVNGRPGSTYLVTGSDLQLPAGATLTTNTKVRVRANSWILDERSVASVSGTRINLTAGTSHPLTAGWGYFLLGELWMLDTPGEYHYDRANKHLYVWTPNSAAPGGGIVSSSLPLAVDLQSRSHVIVDGLTIRRVGVGVNMRSTTGVVVRNSLIEQTAGYGIDAGLSTSATIERNRVTNTGADAISGIDDFSAGTNGLRVVNNAVSSSGVVMSGSTAISLPQRSRAAIRGGVGSVISGNRVIDAGYMGIWVMGGSTVSANFVSGACSVIDDCGGIYTSGSGNNGSITGNVVQFSRGAINGKGGQYVGITQAHGIYLDEYASGVTVSGNTALNNDSGIKLHVAANNTIRDNKVYGNRKSQILLHSNKNTVRSTGDVFGNVVSHNQVAPTTAIARGISLETEYASTDSFGTFDYNKYLDRVFPSVGSDTAGGTRRDMPLPDWKAAVTSSGAPRNLDVNGRGVSQTTYAGSTVTGSNIVPNGNFVNATGWTVWNKTQPFGALALGTNSQGSRYGQYTAGTSTGMLSSPRFSVVQGQWYRMSFDLKANVNGQRVETIVRRGGGGSNGFESLMSIGFQYPVANTGWQRFKFQFQAKKTVNVNDPITGDLGARLDFQNILAGQVIEVANVVILPIMAADATTTTDILLNTSATAMQMACPVANTNAAACADYVRLSDDTPIAWPYYLPALSAEIVYTRDSALIDSDVDGIPDSQDSCAGTAAGATVNSRGCSLMQ